MLYLDTSAFLKLLLDEVHSEPLRAAVAHKTAWSSSLLGLEAHRSARRLGVAAGVIDTFLSAITLITISETTMLNARTVGGDDLRTLDAMHLAAALELGTDLEAVLTYDVRLARACRSAEVSVLTPGMPDHWYV